MPRPPGRGGMSRGPDADIAVGAVYEYASIVGCIGEIVGCDSAVIVDIGGADGCNSASVEGVVGGLPRPANYEHATRYRYVEWDSLIIG